MVICVTKGCLLDDLDCGSFGKEKNSNFSEGGNVDIVELLLDKGVDVSAGDGVGNAALMSDAGAGCRDEPFRRNRKNTASMIKGETK